MAATPSGPANPADPAVPAVPVPAGPDPLIDFQDISLRRGGQSILSGINWRVGAGENWAVVGANGSGKTTLLRIAAGMLFPSAGTARVLGRTFGQTDLAALRRRIGWVSSALAEYIPPYQTAVRIVAGGLVGAFAPIRPATPAELATAQALLERAGMAARAETQFGVLSAGERQKALLCRAMAPEPELLILDEVAASLDLAARENFLDFAARIAAEKKENEKEKSARIIMVTHHIEEIPPQIAHALILREGKVLAAGRTGEVLTPATLGEAFGLAVGVRRQAGRFYAAIE